MKNLYYQILLAAAAVFLLHGCYSDNIDSLDKNVFQLPVNITSEYHNKTVPSNSQDFTNLYQYTEYRDNKEKIKSAEILMFNYWIDSLVLENKVYDPNVDNLEFTSVTFKLQFAKPLPGYGGSDTDPGHWTLDPSDSPVTLGQFTNANIRDFYRKANHIILVPNEVLAKINEMLKTRSQFFLITEYSGIKGQASTTFPYIRAKFDMILRFDINS